MRSLASVIFALVFWCALLTVMGLRQNPPWWLCAWAGFGIGQNTAMLLKLTIR